MTTPSMDGLDENDLDEHFIRAAGPGGQNVNKVATKVVLTHKPTGLSVVVQDSRSQARNRALARERLLEALQQAELRKRQERTQAREKARRRNAPRPAFVKRRMVEAKRRRGEIKKGRSRTTEAE